MVPGGELGLHLFWSEKRCWCETLQQLNGPITVWGRLFFLSWIQPTPRTLVQLVIRAERGG